MYVHKYQIKEFTIESGEGAILIDNLVYTGTDKGASALSGETLEDVANINIIRNYIGSVLGDGRILFCPTYDPVLKFGFKVQLEIDATRIDG